MMASRQEVPIKAPAGLLYSDLTDDVFRVVAERMGLELVSWRETRMGGAQGFHTAIAEQTMDCGQKIIGHRAFEVSGKRAGSDEVTTQVVALKSKERRMTGLAGIMGMIHPDLVKPAAEQSNDKTFPLNTNYLREIRIAERNVNDPILASIQPKVYYTLLDEEKEQFMFISEYLDPSLHDHADAIEGGAGIESWDDESISKVLQDLAGFHGSFYGRQEEVQQFLGCEADMIGCWSRRKDYYSILSQLMFKEYPLLYNRERVHLVQKLLNDYDGIFEYIQKGRKTLAHWDFTPKNLCTRLKPTEGETYLCAYDWELAHLSPPHIDVVSFLATSLPIDIDNTQMKKFVEHYRNHLHTNLVSKHDPLAEATAGLEPFMQMFDRMVMVYILCSLPVYFILSKFVQFPYFTRLAENLFNYLQSVKSKYVFLE